MSFQDIQNGGRPASSSKSTVSKSPSQAVAAGIFQISTAVSAFRRLVDAIGTAKDTLDHRQKLFVLSLSHLQLFENPSLFSCLIDFFDGFSVRHNTRQRILQLVKETSAKLKTLSESDRDANVNVILTLPTCLCVYIFSF